MLPPTVGLGTLRRLGEIDFGGRQVLSLYVDLGARNTPRATSRELEALVAEIGRGGLQDGCVEALRKSLRAIPPLAWATRGLAVFSGPDGSPLEMVPLPDRVQTLAVLDTTPWVEPLAGMLTAGTTGAAYGPMQPEPLQDSATAAVSAARMNARRVRSVHVSARRKRGARQHSARERTTRARSTRERSGSDNKGDPR